MVVLIPTLRQAFETQLPTSDLYQPQGTPVRQPGMGFSNINIQNSQDTIQDTKQWAHTERQRHQQSPCLKPLPSDAGTRDLQHFIPRTRAAQGAMIMKDLDHHRKDTNKKPSNRYSCDTGPHEDRWTKMCVHMCMCMRERAQHTGFRLFSNQAITGSSWHLPHSTAFLLIYPWLWLRSQAFLQRRILPPWRGEEGLRGQKIG